MVILLYRPFVELGHLRDPGGQVTERSWQKCIKAADTMSDVLRIHSETLGFRRAPFLISYCAYIAATIVRLAADVFLYRSCITETLPHSMYVWLPKKDLIPRP